MALSAATIWEVRSVTGGDTNGGGFVEGATGTDYSQQNGKNVGGVDGSTSDAVANGTTTITSATATFGTSIVGNIIYFAGGTGSIAGQWRQVTARASSTSITIDASIAASTGMTMNIGGSLATTNVLFASGQLVTGMSIYAKGSESRSTAFTALAANVRLVGYTTTRGDGGKFSYIATAGVANFFSATAVAVAENLKFDGGSQSHTGTFAAFSNSLSCLRNIEVTGVSGSANAANFTGSIKQIWLHDNPTTGTILAPGTLVIATELEINGNSACNRAIWFNGSVNQSCIGKFAIYNNAGEGIRSNANYPVQLENGIIYGQTGVGLTAISTTSVPGVIADRVIVANCSQAFSLTSNSIQKFRIRLKSGVYEYNNTSSSAGNFEGTLNSLGGDPFIAAASGNFGLSPSGANFSTLKSLGFTYPRGTTVDYGAAGAAQPQAASAGLVRVGFDGGYDG